MEPVLLTENATFDPLSDDDYRKMFQSIRGYYKGEDGTEQWELSYRDFTREVGMDESSKAEWNRWWNRERGYGSTKWLSREYRNALRRQFRRDGKQAYPELPPTVADAVATNTSPDAAVYQVGQGVADKVILLAPQNDAVTLYINGDVRLGMDVSSQSGGAVPSGTRSRRPMYRPVLAPETKERVEASGMTVQELIDYALEVRAREF